MRLLKFIHSGELKGILLWLKFKLNYISSPLSLVSTTDSKGKRKGKEKGKTGRKGEGGGEIHAAEKPFWEYLVQRIIPSHYLMYQHRQEQIKSTVVCLSAGEFFLTIAPI